MKVVILLILMSLDLYSQEDRWLSIAETSEDIFYFDLETFRYEKNGGKNHIWVKIISKNNFKPDPSNNYLAYLLQKWIISCDNRQIEVIQRYAYLDNGEYTENNSYEINEIIPETIGEDFYKFFCK